MGVGNDDIPQIFSMKIGCGMGQRTGVYSDHVVDHETGRVLTRRSRTVTFK
jgi:hypothetical protein